MSAADIIPPDAWPAPQCSPDVAADGRVTFRLRAPRAAEVVLQGQWPGGRADLKKDGQGVWHVTVGPVPAGIWEYGFVVDGLMIPDLLNPALKPMREPRVSILHLPADPPAPHDFQDVPHGTVRLHAYRSRSLGRLRAMRVYTPPDYDRQPDARFPTLFLQHGMGDTQDTWTEHGKAHWILDHLIAAGRAVPMIVVMLDGHAHTEDTGPEGFGRNTAGLRRDLLEDALPFFEANYRARPDADSRAIAGLSMGGGHALTIGLNHPEIFRWVGAFSAAIPPNETIRAWLDDPEAADKKPRLLWLAIGRDDFLLEMNLEFHALLQQRGLRHAWHLTDGDHSWPVWRCYLADFVPKLFQPAAE